MDFAWKVRLSIEWCDDVVHQDKSRSEEESNSSNHKLQVASKERPGATVDDVESSFGGESNERDVLEREKRRLCSNVARWNGRKNRPLEGKKEEGEWKEGGGGGKRGIETTAHTRFINLRFSRRGLTTSQRRDKRTWLVGGNLGISVGTVIVGEANCGKKAICCGAARWWSISPFNGLPVPFITAFDISIAN